jgi:hypothetical protein
MSERNFSGLVSGVKGERTITSLMEIEHLTFQQSIFLD